MNYILPKKFYFLFFLYIVLIFHPTVWAEESGCSDIKREFYNHADQLTQEIEVVEHCARPAETYRDKVYSNLKYRTNRLKTCIQMVKQGDFNFDCSREFRKTIKANGGENCTHKIKVMKVSFVAFEALFSSYQRCSKNNKN
jgi:hypothetical protein